MTEPKSHTIAAIIPLYNGARFIEDALASVLGQTRPPDEVIVVDDGSTDDGAALAERFAAGAPGFKLVRKENGGQASARNQGVAQSSSTLIAFLDQDDIWYPWHLERLIEPFERSIIHNLGWTYANLDEVDIGGKLVKRRLLDPENHPKQSVFQCVRQDMFVLPSASLIARDAFEAVGGFDEQLIGYEDDDLFLRIFREGYDNHFIDEAVSKWRIHVNSTSFTEHMLKSRILYARKLLAAFPDVQERYQFTARDAIAPRFVASFLSAALNCARFDRPEQMPLVRNALLELAPFLSPGKSLCLRAMLPAITNVPVMRAMMKIGMTRIAGRLRRSRDASLPAGLRKG